MAIDYSINPWAVGAVTFDQRPSIAFTQQQVAKQQAKDAALDNYFKDLNKNVTPAGMRSQDVPSLLEKQKEWQQFYQQNKSAITNPKLDNGKAYNEYFARYQDQLGLVNESKESNKNKEQLGKLKFNKDFGYIFDDPHVLKDIELDDLPIGHPQHKPLNIAAMAVPPKPWGIKETDQYSKYLTGGLVPDEIMGKTENLPGFKTRTEILKQYSPENKKVIGQRAMNAYDSEKELRIRAKHLTDELSNDPTRYEQLNSVFKGIYGKDIDSPQEALAAQAMFDEDRRSKSYKEGTDNWGRDNAMRALRQADAKELIRFRKQIDPNDTEMNNTWVESYLGNRILDAKAAQKVHHIVNGKDIGGKGYAIEPDPVLMKALSRNNTEPDRVYVTEDNKIWPIFYVYQKDPKGNVTLQKTASGLPLVDEDYSRPMSMEQAKLALGYKGQTKKQLEGTMQSNKKTAQPKSNTDPLGLF